MIIRLVPRYNHSDPASYYVSGWNIYSNHPVWTSYPTQAYELDKCKADRAFALWSQNSYWRPEVVEEIIEVP